MKVVRVVAVCAGVGLAAYGIDRILNPRSNNVRDMKFLLYSDASNKDNCTELKLGDNVGLQQTGFDAKNKLTILLMHGYNSNAKEEFPTNVKNAYLSTHSNDYNIICVDWGQLSGRLLDYYQVLERQDCVARRVTDFLIWLVKTEGLDLANVHLIGHSVGAHICGQVGFNVQAEGMKLERITGLGPAGPGYRRSSAPKILKKTDFKAKGMKLRRIIALRRARLRHLTSCRSSGPRMLRKADADFVEVFHTSTKYLETKDRLGHVDHFVNGGIQQPICSCRDWWVGTCSHSEAHRVFTRKILDGTVDEAYQLFESQGAHASTSSSTQQTITPVDDLYPGTFRSTDFGGNGPTLYEAYNGIEPPSREIFRPDAEMTEMCRYEPRMTCMARMDSGLLDSLKISQIEGHCYGPEASAAFPFQVLTHPC